MNLTTAKMMGMIQILPIIQMKTSSRAKPILSTRHGVKVTEHPSQVSFNDVKSKSTCCVFGKWFSNLGAGISGLAIYLSALEHELAARKASSLSFYF
ncbi:unnamed protein product [Camellia sinensis]